VTQWGIVRELLFTFTRSLNRKVCEQQAWKFVLQQRDLADVKDVVSLYVLSQVIATQSADVEKGFFTVEALPRLESFEHQNCHIGLSTARKAEFAKAVWLQSGGYRVGS
jgi:hypothetical protein